jgi:hypothetical protein
VLQALQALQGRVRIVGWTWAGAGAGDVFGGRGGVVISVVGTIVQLVNTTGHRHQELDIKRGVGWGGDGVCHVCVVLFVGEGGGYLVREDLVSWVKSAMAKR